MSYVRFRLGERCSAHPSVAGVATVAGGAGGLRVEAASVPAVERPADARKRPNVASVADVAAPKAGAARCGASQFPKREAATLATPATLRIGPEGDRILEAYAQLLGGCLPGMGAVEAFLHRHHGEARGLGWSDAELFGCHPDPSFAFVRYDAMGAVTLSACTGWPISAVVPDHIQFANKLRFLRGTTCFPAVPVWETGPPKVARP